MYCINGEGKGTIERQSINSSVEIIISNNNEIARTEEL
jgi:hypothetical protein